MGSKKSEQKDKLKVKKKEEGDEMIKYSDLYRETTTK